MLYQLSYGLGRRFRRVTKRWGQPPSGTGRPLPDRSDRRPQSFDPELACQFGEIGQRIGRQQQSVTPIRVVVPRFERCARLGHLDVERDQQMAGAAAFLGLGGAEFAAGKTPAYGERTTTTFR